MPFTPDEDLLTIVYAAGYQVGPFADTSAADRKRRRPKPLRMVMLAVSWPETM